MGEPRVSAAAGISVTKVSWSGAVANNLEHAYFKHGRECVTGFHNCGTIAQAANGGGHWFKADKVGACWRIDLHERIAAEKFHFNSLLLRNDGGGWLNLCGTFQFAK